MPGIWNINSVYDTNSKKVFRKLSFEIGENFVARVVNLDKVSGEILLKLLDGWQFSAKLGKPINTLPEGLVRFVVEGFEEGKLQLKIVNTNNKQEQSEKDSINNFLKEKNIDISKDNYELLNKMVKHRIPLTKENVSNIKTLIDFINKTKKDNKEVDTFILKYLQSKNIDTNSDEGGEIKSSLNTFFNEFGSLNEDELLTILENNIDLTEGNIKSFNNVFKNSSVVYSDLKDIENQLLRSLDDENNDKEVNELLNKYMQVENNGDKDDAVEKNIYKVDVLNKNNETIKEASKEVMKLNKNNSIDAEIQNYDLENRKIHIDTNDKIKSNINDKIKSDIIDKKLTDVKLNSDEEANKILGNLTKDGKNIIKGHNIEEVAKSIKEQINIKTEEMKNIIKNILDQKFNESTDSYNNIIQALDKNINDFKIYNLVSNQYYYLDLPIDIDKYQYQCKLMIKDERKKGKKIDSTNVKIAASVNTEHIGTVDAYIKLNNLNMDITIKCNKEWVKALDFGKEKILVDLSKLGYNIYIKVDEKEKEMTIANCREFFENKNYGNIDIKV